MTDINNKDDINPEDNNETLTELGEMIITEDTIIKIGVVFTIMSFIILFLSKIVEEYYRLQKDEYP